MKIASYRRFYFSRTNPIYRSWCHRIFQQSYFSYLVLTLVWLPTKTHEALRNMHNKISPFFQNRNIDSLRDKFTLKKIKEVSNTQSSKCDAPLIQFHNTKIIFLKFNVISISVKIIPVSFFSPNIFFQKPLHARLELNMAWCHETLNITSKQDVWLLLKFISSGIS